MRVLKIELEGTMTSFRHPHLLVGRQPSFPLPPPSTLNGHIASVLGEYPDPESFRFAFAFTHLASVDDYEHTWNIERDERNQKKGRAAPNITASLSPTVRELLFRPRLTLYIDTPELEAWHAAFRSPAFPVALGRSQDLASYTSVQLIESQRAEAGYLEHTLLPWAFRTHVTDGQGVLMPRHIQPDNRQQMSWARYVALTGRVLTPFADELTGGHQSESGNLSYGLPEGYDLWVDPHTPEARGRVGRKRALVWHTLTGPESEGVRLGA